MHISQVNLLTEIHTATKRVYPEAMTRMTVDQGALIRLLHASWYEDGLCAVYNIEKLIN